MDISHLYQNILQQKRQQLIFNSLTDAVLLETASRTIEFVNPSFCALFKLKSLPEEMVGKNTIEATFASIFLFKNPSKFIYRVEEIIEQAVSVSQEKVIIYDGTTYLRDYFPLIINNTLTGHLWLYKAVTATPFTNDIKVNLLSVFEKVLETITLPIAIFNQDQRYVFINKIGLPNDDKRKFIIGKTDSEFCNYYNLPIEAAAKQTIHFQLALAQQKEIRFEAELVDKKGIVTYQQHIFYPLSLPDTSELFVVKYSINITTLKQGEVALQQTIAGYTNILNSLNDVVILADDKLKVDFLNKVWKNYFVETNNDSIFNLVSIKNYEFYQKAFAVLSDGTKQLSGKIDLLQKDGSKKWFKYNIGAGVANDTNDKGIVAILNNITSDVLLEENLLEVVKREKELNDLKSAFVNMVSHELRTPLAVISSGAEIIQMMLAVGKPAAEIEAYTVQIISEVERMTAFMNDLLMVSKIEAGKIEFNTQLIDLHIFITELAATSYTPFKDGRILDIIIKGTPQNLAVDTKMLRHILQNLIDNAFKYSNNKQTPQLRLRYSKTYVTISVIDAGIGIHEDDIQKLFSSFSRGRNVANIAGTGMGLVVVKYFVTQHMGNIFIKSKIDVGSIFSVKIPYINA